MLKISSTKSRKPEEDKVKIGHHNNVKLNSRNKFDNSEVEDKEVRDNKITKQKNY